MIREGEGRYTAWKRRTQSLSYIFREEIELILTDTDLDTVFARTNGHPPILKKYLSGDISLETLVICDRILGYRNDYDKQLTDPVWETVSLRIKKIFSLPKYRCISL